MTQRGCSRIDYVIQKQPLTFMIRFIFMAMWALFACASMSQPIDSTSINRAAALTPSNCANITTQWYAAGQIPSGYYKSNADSQCYPIPSCAGGTAWNGSSQACLSVCTGGTYWNGASCVCPAGQVWSSWLNQCGVPPADPITSQSSTSITSGSAVSVSVTALNSEFTQLSCRGSDSFTQNISPPSSGSTLFWLVNVGTVSCSLYVSNSFGSKQVNLPAIAVAPRCPAGASMENGLCLYPCPSTIWMLNGAKAVYLNTYSPAFAAPNGNPHCIYLKQEGDRHAAAFDRVVGKAVDWFTLWGEYKDGWWWRLTFKGYVPVYSNNLVVQGAQCSNRPHLYEQLGYEPGTCYPSGSGNMGRMCFIDTDPASPLGTIARKRGMTRVVGGGSPSWGNFAGKYNGTWDGYLYGDPVIGYWPGMGPGMGTIYGSRVEVHQIGFPYNCSQGGISDYATYGGVTPLPDPGTLYGDTGNQ